MTKTEKALTPEFATALLCRERFIGTRLIALGHAVTCTRCGGSGEYSYCRQYGTKCFKCGGYGNTAPKLTKTLLKQVTAEVEAGALEPYLAMCRRRRMAKDLAKHAIPAWGSNITLVREKAAGVFWMQQSQMQAAINDIASPMQDKVEDLAGAIKNGVWDYDTKNEVALTAEQVDAAATEIARLIEDIAHVEQRLVNAHIDLSVETLAKGESGCDNHGYQWDPRFVALKLELIGKVWTETVGVAPRRK